MLTNEIRDFLARAPRRWKFNGCAMENYDNVRKTWLDEIRQGTIDERINRRAGYAVHKAPFYAPWRGSAEAALYRKKRKEFKRAHGYTPACYLLM